MRREAGNCALNSFFGALLALIFFVCLLHLLSSSSSLPFFTSFFLFDTLFAGPVEWPLGYIYPGFFSFFFLTMLRILLSASTFCSSGSCVDIWPFVFHVIWIFFCGFHILHGCHCFDYYWEKDSGRQCEVKRSKAREPPTECICLLGFQLGYSTLDC